MTDEMQTAETTTVLISDDPETWGPREAPVDMPSQSLEFSSLRFELGQLLRLFMPSQRI